MDLKKTLLTPFSFGHCFGFIGIRQIISTFSLAPKESIKKQGKLVFIHFFLYFHFDKHVSRNKVFCDVKKEGKKQDENNCKFLFVKNRKKN